MTLHRRVPRAVLADGQRRRTITARAAGAVAETPFFIALVPAYIAFLWQEVRFHLRVVALHEHDPADSRIAADFLVLRGVTRTQSRPSRNSKSSAPPRSPCA